MLKGDLEIVKELIGEREGFKLNRQLLTTKAHFRLPHEITFQFHGWAIVLLKSGKWFFTDTSGG